MHDLNKKPEIDEEKIKMMIQKIKIKTNTIKENM